jgi:hypothetical protein
MSVLTFILIQAFLFFLTWLGAKEDGPASFVCGMLFLAFPLSVVFMWLMGVPIFQSWY